MVIFYDTFLKYLLDMFVKWAFNNIIIKIKLLL